MSIDHYENFPVASVLCPKRIRPAVLALYRFARTADDLADEGPTESAQRLQDLAEYRADLEAMLRREPLQSRWRPVFEQLAPQVQHFSLPSPLLFALLDAFDQDVRNPPYPDRAALLHYCQRSANPVGRLLLHLYGLQSAEDLAQSDAICTALQLINFWQDLSVDLPRQRLYVPANELRKQGLEAGQLCAGVDSPASQALVQDLCTWAQQLMHQGAPLALRLPGGGGWELRLVVQGGLRILEKIGHMDHAVLRARPKLNTLDAPLLLWRAARMPAQMRMQAAAA